MNRSQRKMNGGDSKKFDFKGTMAGNSVGKRESAEHIRVDLSREVFFSSDSDNQLRVEVDVELPGVMIDEGELPVEPTITRQRDSPDLGELDSFSQGYVAV